MSTQSPWDDAQIHAYVDGALDAETSARLDADSRGDAALAARVARQRELRTLLRAEFDPVLKEPIPQPLLDALARPAPGVAVRPIGTARKEGVRARPVWAMREWGAIAATLLLGVFVGQLAFHRTSSPPIETEQGRFVAAGFLDTALSTQLAGAAPEGAAARIGLSFRAASGEYCRTFGLQTGAGGVACRRGGRWSVELLEGAAAVQPGAPGDFRQASSALSPAILGAINALGAGDPLTSAEERQRVGSGWDSGP
jgi:anti-sigma factor RsiW